MRQDFFEFDPQFKLMIAGNHKPSLHGVDEAIRRRLHLVPFTVTIPPTERDAEPGEQAQGRVARHPAVGHRRLPGMAAGRPAAARVRGVGDADYLTDEDSLGQWLAERTDRKGGMSTLLKMLYEDWRTWANARGHAIRTDKWLSAELVKRGHHKSRSSGSGASFELALKPLYDVSAPGN